MAVGQSALEGLMIQTDKEFWRDRPTFVTGATGLVGGWLVKFLVAAGADVVCLVRDWVPDCEMVRSGRLDKVKVVRGDITDQEMMERALGEHEIDTVIHLAAQTIVGIANRNPVSTFEANIAGTWRLLEACRRSPRVKQIVVASSDKAYGDQEILPYDETTPLQGQHPYDVSKSCAARPRSSALMGRSSGTISMSRTARRPTCCWPRAWRRTRACAARLSTSPTSFR